MKKVLDIYSERVGPNFPRLHFAILPADAQALAERLERYNIEVLRYPPGEHGVAWDVIRATLEHLSKKPRPVVPDTRQSVFDTVRRFLASCYVRLKIAPEIQPLKSVITEGLVLGLIVETNTPCDQQLLANAMRKFLPLSEDEAAEVVSRALRSLVQRGICAETEGRHIELARVIDNTLDQDLNLLVRGVCHRLTVREGMSNPETHASAIKEILEEMLLERGWDLGAHFAAAHTADSFDLMRVIRNAVGRKVKDNAKLRDDLVRATLHLVSAPEEAEASVLTELGRLSFGIDMAVERTRGTLLLAEALPERLFLDANVLMPLIVPAHPAGQTYSAAIAKLAEAGTVSGVDAAIVVARPFLTEVVVHRRNSRDVVREYGLEDARKLLQYRGLGLAADNVFVAAYATAIVDQRRAGLTYNQFLQEVAPFESEEGLGTFLRRRGIQVAALEPVGDDERAQHNRIRTVLYAEYDKDEKAGRKPGVLVDDEALQLWALDYESRHGRRSVFVTQDSRLRRLIGAGLAGLSGLVLSPLALVQLIDLLVGIKPESKSFARVMWPVRNVAGPALVRDYLIDKGLAYYFEEAYAKGVPDLVRLVEAMSKEAEAAAARRGVKFEPATEGEVKRTLSFFDEFEAGFYEKMAKEIRKGQS